MLEGEGDTFWFHQTRILIARMRCHKPKIKNCQITEARSTNLTLEGEGDALVRI
jgi:hypothetical protein